MTARHDDLYRVLQVDPAASPLVIQAAYRVLAQIFHPDVDGDTEHMKRINGAWEVLRDPDRRRRYDAEREHRRTHGAAPTFGTGSPPATGAQAAPSPTRGEPRAEDHAGPPPGEPFGPVMRYGRYEGWSIGQVARVDRPFLEWLRRVPAGRAIKADIDVVLKRTAESPAYAHRRREALETKSVHTWAPGAKTSLR